MIWHHFALRRRFGREGSLKYIILWLLNESPKNGVEIISEIERMSLGWWRPSPGSVYPVLLDMAQEGLVIKRSDGRYEITEKGLSEIEEVLPVRKPRDIQGILEELESYALYLEEIGKEKLAPYREKLESIKSRIEKLI